MMPWVWGNEFEKSRSKFVQSYSEEICGDPIIIESKDLTALNRLKRTNEEVLLTHIQLSLHRGVLQLPIVLPMRKP